MHAYTVLYYLGFIVKSTSVSLNIFVFILLCRGKNDLDPIYKHVLKWTIATDVVYVMSSAVFYPVILFVDSYSFLIFDIVLLPKSSVTLRVAFFMETATILAAVGVLPSQPIVRYYKLISSVCTKEEVNKMFFKGFSAVLAFSGFCTYFQTLKGGLYDKILSEQTTYLLENPMYIVFDPARLGMYWPMLCTVLFTLSSITTVFIFILKVRWKMVSVKEHLTAETRAMERRMRNIIIAQVTYPVFCLTIPAALIGLVPLLQSKYSSLSEVFSLYTIISLHIFPLLNPLSIIVFIPSNRNAVKRMLTCQIRRKKPCQSRSESHQDARTRV